MDDKKGLGRGLTAIFNNFQKETSSRDVVAVELDIEQISPNPNQPRKFFDEEKMAELVSSIRREGVLQPILVRKILQPDAEIGYQIIAGERRWRAAQSLQLKALPAVVIECDDQVAVQLGLIENLQRADLNAIEEARSIKILIEEYHKTQEEVASMISKSRSYVANALRLLKLPDNVQEMVENKQLSAGHARALLESPDPEDFARNVVEQKLNVRDVERLAKLQKDRKSVHREKGEKEGGFEGSEDFLSLERKIGQFFQARTKIIMKSDYPILQISFKDFNDFDQFIEKLAGISL